MSKPAAGTKALLITGGINHDFVKSAEHLVTAMSASDILVTSTQDPAALRNLAKGQFQCVVLFTMHESFDDSDIETLARFVRQGGGLLAIHATLSTNKSSAAFGELLGARIKEGKVIGFDLRVSDPNHPVTKGVDDFSLDDEVYALDIKSDVQPFLSADWNGKVEVQAYSKQEGQGKVVYLGPGHRVSTFADPRFQKLCVQAVAFAAAPAT